MMLQAPRHLVPLGLRYKLYNNNFDCTVCEYVIIFIFYYILSE